MVVGAICFAPMFCLFVVIGVLTHILPMILIGPPDFEARQANLFWIVTWVGSAGLASLPARAFFRYAKKAWVK